jgi:hypothetical protein
MSQLSILLEEYEWKIAAAKQCSIIKSRKLIKQRADEYGYGETFELNSDVLKRAAKEVYEDVCKGDLLTEKDQRVDAYIRSLHKNNFLPALPHYKRDFLIQGIRQLTQ